MKLNEQLESKDPYRMHSVLSHLLWPIHDLIKRTFEIPPDRPEWKFLQTDP